MSAIGEVDGGGRCTCALAEALDEAHRTLDQVQAWGGVGFWSLDLRTLEPYWSTQVFEILGLQVDSLEDYLEGIHPDDRALVDQVGRRARRQPGPYRAVHRYLRGGDLRTLSHHMQSVAGPDGRPVRLIGVMSDTTHLSELQAQVDDAASVRNVGLVASTLVHSFKNQLAVVAGHAQLAINAMDKGSAPDRDGLLAIQRAAVNGAELARQVLELGRPTTSVRHRVDARPILERVAALARPIVGPANVVSVEVDDDVPVLADGQRLEQVLVDFVINAADALPRSGGLLRLGFRRLEVRDDAPAGLAPGTYGAFAVVDDGEGMDEETLRRATEPFFTTKGTGRGTGIGLSSASTFAAEVGGRLDIRSARGSGTAVELVLPLAPAPAVSPRVRPVRIVVVSDDVMARGAALRHLDDAGVQAVGARSWDEVDRFLRTEPIDAVLVDEGSFRPPGTVLTAPVVEVPFAGADSASLLGALDRALPRTNAVPSRGRGGEPPPHPVEAGPVTGREAM